MKLTVPEAARRVGRSPETVRRWIWNGRLPSEKVGNQHLVDADALDALTGAVEPAPDEGEAVEVAGEWGDWLRRAEAFHGRLRAKGVRLPPAADLIRESRRGH
jgi:excisionase family DNA binding protein